MRALGQNPTNTKVNTFLWNPKSDERNRHAGLWILPSHAADCDQEQVSTRELMRTMLKASCISERREQYCTGCWNPSCPCHMGWEDSSRRSRDAGGRAWGQQWLYQWQRTCPDGAESLRTFPYPHPVPCLVCNFSVAPEAS